MFVMIKIPFERTSVEMWDVIVIRIADFGLDGLCTVAQKQSIPVLSLQEKIERMWKRKIEERTDFNFMIQHKKAFRNPSIYEKLILHLDIDELGKGLRYLAFFLFTFC
jgi:HCNGP-like protein